ncbi:MAG: YitT family protein [Bacillota bacterium]|nr:YitT family protein [Bacillota bacterium]
MAGRRSTKKTPLKKHIRNIAMISLGSLVCTAGYLILITPNDLLAGGVWGVAAILNHYLPRIPMGAFLVILNIPLLLWGWNKLRLRFAVYTVYAILLQSALLILIEPYLPTYTANPLLACIFGGVLVGVGSGTVVRYHGSGGGTDVIGIILKSKYDISIGTISLIVNALIVFCAAFIFGFERAMYTMVNLFISARVFTQVLEGLNRKRNVMIISEHGDAIAERLLHEVGRGVTKLHGEGGYTRKNKDVLFCVVSRFELALLKEVIQQIDPQAFVCINETYEVLGSFPKHAALEALMSEEQQAAILDSGELPQMSIESEYDSEVNENQI